MHDAPARQAESLARINLADYHTHGVRVISGRGRGEKVRQAAELDKLDAQLGTRPDSHVTVVVPDSVVYVASSFYLGLFGPSIRRFDADGFRRRYRFEGPYSEENLKDSIKEAIDRGTREAVKRGSPLPSVA